MRRNHAFTSTDECGEEDSLKGVVELTPSRELWGRRHNFENYQFAKPLAVSFLSKMVQHARVREIELHPSALAADAALDGACGPELTPLKG